MPRLAGQVDRLKAEAMLDAAAQVIAERGMGAPVAAIAKRAGVSKQTLYNHYGGKAGLVRVLILRRVDEFAAPLADPGGDTTPEAALTAFALGLMTALLAERYLTLLRVAIQGAADIPDLARTLFETASKATRAHLVEYLRAETRAGRLGVDDAEEAAELFTGMLAARQIRGLIGLPTLARGESLEARCASIARRFVRAYAPIAET
jgi:TetR/AcrR family transcriptional repressor of mexJK operon